MTVPLASPASEIAAWAEDRLSPVTSGTVISAGPLETSTVTVLPWRSTVPAGGSVPITTPGGHRRAGRVVDLGDEAGAVQRGRSLRSACSPWTSGRATLAGPPETTILTVEPLSRVAARGRRLGDHQARGHPHAGRERWGSPAARRGAGRGSPPVRSRRRRAARSPASCAAESSSTSGDRRPPPRSPAPPTATSAAGRCSSARRLVLGRGAQRRHDQHRAGRRGLARRAPWRRPV